MSVSSLVRCSSLPVRQRGECASVRQFVSSSYRDELNDELTPTPVRAADTGQFVTERPSEAELLVYDIATVCAQIDTRLGNPLGTAERGCYFWYGPPPRPDLSPDVLAALHRDAVEMLHSIVAS